MAGRRTLVVLAAFAAAWLTADPAPASSCPPASWPQLGRTPARAGSGTRATGLDRSHVRRLRRAWSAVISDGPSGNASGVDNSPVVVCGVVYAASHDGHVYAFAAGTGKRRWRTISGPGGALGFWGTPAVAGGALYATGGDGAVYAYSAKTGHMLWRTDVTPLKGGANPATLVAGDTVYVMAAPNELTAIDGRSGVVRWVTVLGSSSFLTSPSLADGRLYVGADTSLFAVDARTGTQLWTAPTGAEVWSTPTVVAGLAYVGSSDHDVYAFDAASGAQIWAAPTGDRVYSTAPVAAGGTVFAGSLDDRLHALDAASGAERWSFVTGDDVTGSPAIASGVVFVGSQDGRLYALDTRSGARLWSDDVGPGSARVPRSGPAASISRRTIS